MIALIFVIVIMIPMLVIASFLNPSFGFSLLIFFGAEYAIWRFIKNYSKKH